MRAESYIHRLEAEGGVDAGAVKADNNLAIDVEYRDAHLAGFLDRFLGVGRVFLDVLFGKRDTFVGEVIFGGVAKGTPIGAVHRYAGSSRIIHSLKYIYYTK
jgi:hypothetical protein